MDRDRSFNFKLLVPPRVNNAQTPAVRPQEVVENCGEFMDTLQRGYTKCFDKELNMPFHHTSVIAPTKPTRHDFPKMKVPPMEKEENDCNTGQLYSKLFDEVEKIKCWKVKVDYDAVQKERRLQENKRTIETQRKAIQELQFGNESLSMKLGEQISENEELRNKNNATQSLYNILKDTFERSADKMHLFESEREETHHLLMENSESIQKLVAAFENLHIQAEADQKELQRVKECLLQFEALNEKHHQEYNMKEEEVRTLQTKLEDKENELEKILLDLHETQDHCRQLQETSNQQCELLKYSKIEQESSLQKLRSAEQSYEGIKANQEATARLFKDSKEKYELIIQSKDLSLQDLYRDNNQQAEKLKQIQTTMQELQNSLAHESKRANEHKEKLMENDKELEKRNALLRETTEDNSKKDGQIRILEDELDNKLKSIKSMRGDMDVLQVKVVEMEAELLRNGKEAQLYKSQAEIAFAENDQLKKAYEAAEKAEAELTEKYNMIEIKVHEQEGQLSNEIQKNEEHTLKIEQMKKDVKQQTVIYEELLSNFNEVQSEKKAIEQQFEKGSSNVKAVEANMKVLAMQSSMMDSFPVNKASERRAMKLTREIKTLEEENKCLREEIKSIKGKIQGTCQESKTLKKKMEENFEHLKQEITKKEHKLKAMEAKLCNLRKKTETKLKVQHGYQKENTLLKKQLAEGFSKSSQLENMIDGLQKESQNLKRLNEENHEKLLKDLESKSSFATELEKEIQKLKLIAAEAINSQKDTEVKCQQKTADMVALMEKHKSQYDRMVAEKEAELDTIKQREVEVAAHRKSLERDASMLKAENNKLKKQRMTDITEKENLERDLADLRREVSSLKHFTVAQQPETRSSKKIPNEDLATPRCLTNRVGGTSKIKSYRIRTPTSTGKIECLKNRAIAVESNSDSSDQNDLLTFTNTPAPSFSVPQSKYMFKKIPSPATQKSPGNSLKLAAVKRMRDAGWAAVAGCGKKKKANEKIFA